MSVSSSFSSLNLNVAELEKGISSLYDKLGPILKPEVSEKLLEETTVNTNNSSLATDIDNIANVINKLVAKCALLESRIDLL